MQILDPNFVGLPMLYILPILPILPILTVFSILLKLFDMDIHL